MILILEGADMTGKTDIGKALSKKLNIPYFKNHCDKRAFIDNDDYSTKLMQYADPYVCQLLKQTKYPIIIDRHYPSEWVYSKVFDRFRSSEDLENSDKLFSDLGAIILFFRRKSFEGIQDDLFPNRINSEVLTKIDKEYENFVKWTKCKVITIYVDDEDIDRELNEIIEKLELK